MCNGPFLYDGVLLPCILDLYCVGRCDDDDDYDDGDSGDEYTRVTCIPVHPACLIMLEGMLGVRSPPPVSFRGGTLLVVVC